jgi:hypothetical protein
MMLPIFHCAFPKPCPTNHVVPLASLFYLACIVRHFIILVPCLNPPPFFFPFDGRVLGTQLTTWLTTLQTTIDSFRNPIWNLWIIHKVHKPILNFLTHLDEIETRGHKFRISWNFGNNEEKKYLQFTLELGLWWTISISLLTSIDRC